MTVGVRYGLSIRRWWLYVTLLIRNWRRPHKENLDTPEGKMYSSEPGMSLKADILVLKFFASASLGTCASQSVN